MSERMLPQNIEAEMGVLGSIIIDPESLPLVADRLRPEHFYREANRVIYEAMMHLYERQESPDQFSVYDLLERRGKLDLVGGWTSINDLVQETVTSGKLETYAQRVIDTAILRRVIAAGGQIVQMAWNAGDESAASVLEQSEALIYEVSRSETVGSEVSSAASVFSDWFAWFDAEEATDGSIAGIPSGLSEIDRMTGGFQRSDLIIVAGRPAMGKTSLCMAMARAAAMQHQMGVLIFSLEMSKTQLIQRLTAMEACVNVQHLMQRRLSPEERARVVNVGSSIVDAPLFIDDTAGISLAQMRSKIRRELARHPVDLIIIDFLQLVQATIDGKRIRDRYQEVSEVARGLKNLAKEFDVPVIALSQLSRAVEGRANKVPQMSDLRESGEIEQAADIVMFIHRDDYYAGYDEAGWSKSNRPGTADIVFAKQRNGPTGEVVVGFEKTQTRFSNLEEVSSHD